MLRKRVPLFITSWWFVYEIMVTAILKGTLEWTLTSFLIIPIWCGHEYNCLFGLLSSDMCSLWCVGVLLCHRYDGCHSSLANFSFIDVLLFHRSFVHFFPFYYLMIVLFYSFLISTYFASFYRSGVVLLFLYLVRNKLIHLIQRIMYSLGLVEVTGQLVVC